MPAVRFDVELHEVPRRATSRDERLLTLGAAKNSGGRVYSPLAILLTEADRRVSAGTFTFGLDRKP